jgi:HAD superfamily hydrolase (TIGR01509 family)
MASTISTLLFDMAEVLVDWRLDIVLKNAFPDDAVRRHVLAHIDLEYWSHEWDKGRLSDTIEKMKKVHPEFASYCQDFYDHCIDGYGDIHHDTVEIVKELKDSGYKLYLASNWASDFFETGRSFLTFLPLFDGTQISGCVGLAKPDVAFFNDMAARFGFDKNEALFIDDRQTNVDGSIAAGIQAIRFENAVTLRRDLKLLGIKLG